MPKEKRKLKNLHKIKIHNNRWLGWVFAVAILAGVALVGYIKISDVHFESQFGLVDYTAKWHVFRHKSDGYSLKYPNTWALEAETGTISFVNPADPNQYFSVTTYDAGQEEQIRKTLFNTKQTSVTIDGFKGVMISQSKKQPESVVMLENDNTLYVLRGKGYLFERILTTFKFQEKVERV
jgi:hypothetical protein